MKLIQALGGETRSGGSLSIDDWIKYFQYQSVNGMLAAPNGTLGEQQEEPDSSFEGYVQSIYKQNGVVFACMLARLLLFSEARFQFRRRVLGRPGELFGMSSLAPLEEPWPGGTTGNLLTRAMQDADLGGNFYAAERRFRVGRSLQTRIMRMRPDWVTIILGSPSDPEVGFGDLDAEVLGYVYKPGGNASSKEPVPFMRDEVAHFAPIPDPLATYRGMSWLTPVIREIMGDQAATSHKLKFFEQGAPQPLDAKVLTPAGWSTMGEMEVGSHVIGRDGKAHSVVAVYPQGEREIFRVTFSDGATTECTQDHIWRVANYYDRKRGTHRTMPLAEIVDNGLAYPSGPLKWSVPHVEPVSFDTPSEPVPVDPYLLGLLLGDGSFRGNGKGSGGISFSASAEDADLLEAVAVKAAPAGVGISRRDRGGWSEMYFRGQGGPKPNPLTTAIRDLGLFDVLGRDKSIPSQYLRGSVNDRIALLQGLVDSDGHVDKIQGCASITTTSVVMAEQIIELVGSLGGTASRAMDGGRTTMRVRIKRLPESIVPCRLPRKVARYSTTNRSPNHRYIKSVERVGRKPAQCISVDSAEHLYVTDDFIVTHNTPNLVVTLDASIQREAFEKWLELFEAKFEGSASAYKTMYLGAGAKVEAVGSDLKNVDFKAVQGAGETRVAAAAGVPPVIVGLSEGLQAATYCLPASESVWTPDGPRSIAALQAGDQVWSAENRERPITWQGCVGVKQVFEIRTKNRVLRATDNHPVLVRIPGRSSGANALRAPSLEYRAVAELRPGDQVVEALSLPDSQAVQPEWASPDLVQWAGAYIGDGSGVGTAGAIRMALPPSDRVRDAYERLTASLFDARIGYELRGFRFQQRGTSELLAMIGLAGVAATKQIPGWVFRLNRDLRLRFLAGLLDTDGSVDARGVGRLGFANRLLVEQARALFVSCGIQVSNVRYRAQSGLGLPNPGRRAFYDFWDFAITTGLGEVPTFDPLYRERLANRRDAREGGDLWKTGLDPNQFGFFTIRSIEPKDVEPVFDISVEGDASFLASGVAVHNSNYGQARRRFADGTMRPLWREIAGAMETLVPAPPNCELWYDDRDISFLQEDRKDEAEIQQSEATTIKELIHAGFTPESAVTAVNSNDMTRLEHTGLVSVQLQQPGAEQPPALPAGK